MQIAQPRVKQVDKPTKEELERRDRRKQKKLALLNEMKTMMIKKGMIRTCRNYGCVVADSTDMPDRRYKKDMLYVMLCIPCAMKVSK